MAYDFDMLLMDLSKSVASDAHLKVKVPVYYRILDELEKTEHPIPTIEDMKAIVAAVLDAEGQERLARDHQADTIFSPEGSGMRFRVSFYMQRGTLGAVIRQIPRSPPTLKEIGMPKEGTELLDKHRGIILITGPAGAGKTTTAASFIRYWNEKKSYHIVTLEDPIEYNIDSGRCVITQRQVGKDTPTFASGLRRVLRQDPDVIYVGELRDLNTVSIAIAAAETGHLVISTLHTPNAATTLEQIIGLFPSNQQSQARTQISITIQGIVSQVLIPNIDRTERVAAFEIMNPSDGMRNLIRNNQTFRVTDAMETTPGNMSLKKSLQGLVRKRVIHQKEAQKFQQM